MARHAALFNLGSKPTQFYNRLILSTQPSGDIGQLRNFKALYISFRLFVYALWIILRTLYKYEKKNPNKQTSQVLIYIYVHVLRVDVSLFLSLSLYICVCVCVCVCVKNAYVSLHMYIDVNHEQYEWVYLSMCGTYSPSVAAREVFNCSLFFTACTSILNLMSCFAAIYFWKLFPWVCEI